MEADLARFYQIHDMRAHPVSHVASLVCAAAGQPESWLHRSLNPDWAWSDPKTRILADLWDVVALIFWAKTRDGSRGKNRPKPYPRPSGDQGKPTPRRVDRARIDAILAAPRTPLPKQ